MTPSSAFLAEMYLKASQQAAEAERSFSLQNIIISDLRTVVSFNRQFIKKIIHYKSIQIAYKRSD